MKILSVVGARPQFIKAAPVSKALREHFVEILVHTGQHYDPQMSDRFFEELNIPVPDYNLNVGSGSHGHQTGAMLSALEDVVNQEQPDYVLVYGDTNSTLAGALTAAKLNIPIAHVEAGLRSYNRAMPEEVNRVVADHCSTLLFCPTETAVANLAQEGIRQGVYHVGDVMFDAFLAYLKIIDEATILARFGLEGRHYLLVTVHRASNTDSRDSLENVIRCLSVGREPIVFPLHPRTAASLKKFGLYLPDHVKAIDPVGYLDMLALEKNARMIMTDSGGVQKEAYMLRVPCVTLRDETEWVETLEAGWNILTGLRVDQVAAALSRSQPDGEQPAVFGNGQAAQHIAQIIGEHYHEHYSH